ncbi:LamG domain-containing protein [Algoriphagus sp. C2-6-M1]|uniref:LamG domain-containing protein n=1 Tax=Algoriphagus persicinus TaxID=3108754 RepID=UPI002B3DDD6D|nr:LamG domain-containing protein [Algoriphagus sp. C2-6-M1]MEB2779581.1 LamG domain-containing protein [Algoriphagus sp. C2-6-M1]
MNKLYSFLLVISAISYACSSDEKSKGAADRGGANGVAANDKREPGSLSILSKSLTFHASFDEGADADFALGDPRIYSGKTAADQQNPGPSEPGLGNPALAIVQGEGEFGDALEFTLENSHVVFFKAEKNVPYTTKDFSGTLSFWLKLDPQKIPQTYTDPVQLTDKDYSNSAIWVDFTKNDTPSDFRLGIFGDQKVWDKKNLKGAGEEFFWRLLKIVKPPFSSDKWTHVVVTWEGINTDEIARGKLYFDAKFQGETGGITEPFVWHLSEAKIRLGTGPFVGMFDDLAIFDRSLTPDEVRDLYELNGGVTDLNPYINGDFVK